MFARGQCQQHEGPFRQCQILEDVRTHCDYCNNRHVNTLYVQSTKSPHTMEEPFICLYRCIDLRCYEHSMIMLPCADCAQCADAFHILFSSKGKEESFHHPLIFKAHQCLQPLPSQFNSAILTIFLASNVHPQAAAADAIAVSCLASVTL